MVPRPTIVTPLDGVYKTFLNANRKVVTADFLSKSEWSFIIYPTP